VTESATSCLGTALKKCWK